jgi:hypothetical protein
MSRKTRKIMNGQYKFKGKKGSKKKKRLTNKKLFCHCHTPPQQEENKILGHLVITRNNKKNLNKMMRKMKKTLSN